MKLENMKNFINTINRAGKCVITTKKKGCGAFLKGRGENSFKNKFGIDLDTITKESKYEVRIGDISYEDVKKANGVDESVEPAKRNTSMKHIDGFENLILVNEKTGDYYLRCYTDKDTKCLGASYIMEDGKPFDVKNAKFDEYRREIKPVDCNIGILTIKLDTIEDIKLA